MTTSAEIVSHLPFLRRYARALTGSQRSGDAYVATTLKAIIASPEALDDSLEARVSLYRLFHTIWTNGHVEVAETDADNWAAKAHERLQHLTPITRQALLLTAVEGFTYAETAQIFGIREEDVAALVAKARKDIEAQLRARILIIEDETLIAMDLSDIVTSLGHSVVGTADTATRAVTAAKTHQPDLVLADIQLADGSSGIDAVEHILKQMTVPVIFVTAFPDRLLTGKRPEPTFLITKPYAEDTVRAAVSQALFFNSTAEAA
jgi:DNA-directed RNA polymerase specialized sigma24 family protein/CheY-like chemotaxis protein